MFKKLLGGLLFSLTFSTFGFSQSGEDLFMQRCSMCHTIGGGNLVGPDLKGSMAKYSQPWLIKWIKSSGTLINAGDAKAVALFKKYNEMMMPDVDLPDNQIVEIIDFVKAKSGGAETAAKPGESAAPAAAGAVAESPGEATGAAAPSTSSSSGTPAKVENAPAAGNTETVSKEGDKPFISDVNLVLVIALGFTVGLLLVPKFKK